MKKCHKLGRQPAALPAARSGRQKEDRLGKRGKWASWITFQLCMHEISVQWLVWVYTQISHLPTFLRNNGNTTQTRKERKHPGQGVNFCVKWTSWAAKWLWEFHDHLNWIQDYGVDCVCTLSIQWYTKLEKVCLKSQYITVFYFIIYLDILNITLFKRKIIISLLYRPELQCILSMHAYLCKVIYIFKQTNLALC